MFKRRQTVIKMVRQAGILLLVLVIITGCQTSTPTPSPSPTLPPTETEIPPIPTKTEKPTRTTRPTNTPKPPTLTPEGYEAFTFEGEDGTIIAGYIFKPIEVNDKQIGLVLAHDLNSTHEVWFSFLEDFTGLGYTVMAFDLRGHGESMGDGSVVSRAMALDVLYAINILKDRGFDQIVCVGAKIGGTGCLMAAMETDLAGLVMISAPNKIGAIGVFDKDLAKIKIPKLVMVAEKDYTVEYEPLWVEDILNMYGLFPEPKQLFLIPGITSGTSMLFGSAGEEALNVLLDFLSSIADS